MRRISLLLVAALFLLFALLTSYPSWQAVRAHETRRTSAPNGKVSVILEAHDPPFRDGSEHRCWVYADGHLLMADELVKFHPARVGSVVMNAQLPPLDLPVGKHTLDVAVELRWRSKWDNEFPFAGLEYNRSPHTVLIESGKNVVAHIGIRDERPDPPGFVFFPIHQDKAKRAQVLLDDLTKRVQETGQKTHSESAWNALMLVQRNPAAMKRGKYVYLDLSPLRGGGREFDEHQIRLLAEWLERQWNWFPFPGLHEPRLPMDTADMTEEQREKYYDLVRAAEASIALVEGAKKHTIDALHRDR